MPTSSRLRQQQRDEVHPLIRAIDARLGHTRSYIELARETGLTNYQVGRLLGESLPSPTYLDLTKLLVAAGMTPNEGARIVGLYKGPDYDRGEEERLSPEERRILKLVREVKLPEAELKIFRSMLEAMLEAFAERYALEQARLRRMESPEGQAASEEATASLYDDGEAPPRASRASRAKNAKNASSTNRLGAARVVDDRPRQEPLSSLTPASPACPLAPSSRLKERV